ncbi:CACTA en-spm transposon protein [Cucumis melo var. makuwa]|uniref:CACTA en-spm transposon protein n=1 Tax=Cucumis melo var. makuwa TaxID=1194695 RepID=A0A5A7TUI9_CUCMM|nr:CACTA en-spm transposon protein [Cucumis melo var. makuwa]
MGMNNCYIKSEQAMTNDSDEPRTMTSFSSDFDKTNAMFLLFDNDQNNTTGGLSSMGDNLGREYIEVVKDDLQHELIKQRGEPVDRVQLFKQTHIRVGTFVPQAVEDMHNQMLELQSKPILESSQPLSRDEICETIFGRRSGYLEGLGWGPKPKSHKMTNIGSSLTLCLQSTVELQLWAKLDEAK